MKKVLLALLMFGASVAAQEVVLISDTSSTYTSPNLVTSTGWTGVGAYAPSPTDCCSNPAGSLPLYDTNTNTIRFSYGQATVKQTWAVNQALANVGAGVQITGYNWGYDLRNMNGNGSTNQAGVDTIVMWTWLTDSAGSVVTSNTATHNTRFDWTRFAGTQNLNNAMAIGDVGSLGISFAGKDGGFWAGLYGPEVRNVNMSLNYKFDVCSADPLSSPSCPNYATAYLNLQCSGNPLYSPQCPGYAQAYFTQQCTVNALFDPSCPGYASAYLTYQCSINPLYSTTCAGYETAYHDQQCSTNPLYATDCRGYEQAHFTQQCNLDGLYSTRCPNYAEAYAKRSLLEKEGMATTVAIAGAVANSDTTSAEVPVIADQTVNSVVTAVVTSVNPGLSATATVPLTPPPEVAAVTVTTKVEVSTPAPAPAEKNLQPTPRQQLQAKREAAARAAAVEKGKNLANDMGKVADIESQKQIQNVVMAAMGFTPGFEAYGKAFVPDGVGYRPFTVYRGQVNVDNARLGRSMFGGTDKLHQELVDSQFKGN